MELSTLGIDLGKTTFHLVGINQRGEVVLRKRFSRSQLLHFTANLKVDLIGMEACGGSHFLGRALREQGHEVRLIPAQYVNPTSRQTRATTSTRKRSLRRWDARGCDSYPSRVKTSWTYSRCIGSVNAG